LATRESPSTILLIVNGLSRDVQRRQILVGRGALALASVASFASLALGGTALAQEASPAAMVAARELFRQGTEDADAGRYAQGLEKFKKVATIKETAAVRFNIARCEESLEKTAAALGDFELAEREASGDPKGDEVAKLARDRAEGLRPKVPRLEISAPNPLPPGLTVLLDGTRLGAGTLGVSLPVDPGPHVVESSAVGRDPFRIQVSLAPAEAKSVAIVLRGSSGADAPSTDQPPGTRPETPASSSTRKTLGFVSIGTAGALGAGAVVFLLLHNNAVSDIQSLCPTSPCDNKNASQVATHQSAANTYQALSVGFTIGAGAAAALGVVLVLTAGSSSSPKQATAPRALLVPGAPGSVAGLSLHLSF
jgi:hypothetical protein